MVKNKLLYFVENDVVSLIELIQVGRDILVKNFVVDVFEYFGVGENLVFSVGVLILWLLDIVLFGYVLMQGQVFDKLVYLKFVVVYLLGVFFDM